MRLIDRLLYRLGYVRREPVKPPPRPYLATFRDEDLPQASTPLEARRLLVNWRLERLGLLDAHIDNIQDRERGRTYG